MSINNKLDRRQKWWCCLSPIATNEPVFTMLCLGTTVHQCSGAGSPSLQQTQVSALQRRLQEEAQLHVDGGVVRDALGRLRVGGHRRLSCTHPMGVTALVGWRPVFVTLGGEHTNHLCVEAVWKLCIPVLSACLYSLAPSVTYWHTHTHTRTHTIR